MNTFAERPQTLDDDSSLTEIVADLYAALQNSRDRSTNERTRWQRQYDQLARHVVDLHVGLFRLEREIRPELSEQAFKLLQNVMGLWRDTDVVVSVPLGEPLTDELLELVDVISSEPRSDASVATVERVDQPIVRIGRQTFRGKVRVALPAGNQSERTSDGQDDSD